MSNRHTQSLLRRLLQEPVVRADIRRHGERELSAPLAAGRGRVYCWRDERGKLHREVREPLMVCPL